MPNPRQTIAQIQASFEKVMANHRRITKILLDALDPSTKQEDRDALRKSLSAYAQNSAPTTKSKPDVPDGASSME